MKQISLILLILISLLYNSRIIYAAFNKGGGYSLELAYLKMDINNDVVICYYGIKKAGNGLLSVKMEMPLTRNLDTLKDVRINRSFLENPSPSELLDQIIKFDLKGLQDKYSWHGDKNRYLKGIIRFTSNNFVNEDQVVFDKSVIIDQFPYDVSINNIDNSLIDAMKLADLARSLDIYTQDELRGEALRKELSYIMKRIYQGYNDTALKGYAAKILTMLNDMPEGAIDNPDRSIRYNALEGLFYKNGRESIPLLIDKLKNDKDNYIRWFAAYALGNISNSDDRDVIDTLEGLMKEFPPDKKGYYIFRKQVKKSLDKVKASVKR